MSTVTLTTAGVSGFGTLNQRGGDPSVVSTQLNRLAGPETDPARHRPIRAVPGRRPRGLDFGAYGPVVKVQDVLTRELPTRSRMLMDVVAVYVVFGSKVALGFKVATRVVAL